MEFWRQLFAEEEILMRIGIAFGGGLMLGSLLSIWVARLLPVESPPGTCPQCGARFAGLRLACCGWRRVDCPECHRRLPGLLRLIPWMTGLAWLGYVVCAVDLQAQVITQVTPDEVWRWGRIGYHLILIGLLVVAMSTDLVDCTISDQVIGVGVLCGLIGAIVSGDLQMVHVWFDWNQEELFRGAYIPQWIKDHRHIHGLIWSLAGALLGFFLIWIIRWCSRIILSAPALGLGDATLMAMVGSFIGWQPVCFVLMLAPLLGILFGTAAILVGGRPYVPFGPALCLAAWVVLCGWKWLWEPSRYVFGHVASLLGISGVGLTALILLLMAVRGYRAIPTRHSPD